MTSRWRQWFRVDRQWVERRDALLGAEEDAMIAAARDRATGAERRFLDALLRIRAANEEARHEARRPGPAGLAADDRTSLYGDPFMSIRNGLLATFLGFALTACTDRALEKRMAVLEAKYAENEKAMQQMALTVAGLDVRLTGLDEQQEGSVSCSDEGYTFVPTQLGKFMVSCGDLKPYGDGYKITLRVGNPHFVTLNGVRLLVRYGPRPQFGTDGAQRVTWVEWQRSLREKRVDLPNVLLPATWNRVDVVIAPAKAEDIGFLGVKMVVDKVSLR